MGINNMRKQLIKLITKMGFNIQTLKRFGSSYYKKIQQTIANGFHIQIAFSIEKEFYHTIENHRLVKCSDSHDISLRNNWFKEISLRVIYSDLILTKSLKMQIVTNIKIRWLKKEI